MSFCYNIESGPKTCDSRGANQLGASRMVARHAPSLFRVATSKLDMTVVQNRRFLNPIIYQTTHFLARTFYHGVAPANSSIEQQFHSNIWNLAKDTGPQVTHDIERIAG